MIPGKRQPKTNQNSDDPTDHGPIGIAVPAEGLPGSVSGLEFRINEAGKGLLTHAGPA